MKYIIMCGSKQDEFKDEPRQLLKINGEQLVARTVRLLKELGVEDIAISTNANNFYSHLGVPLLNHNNSYHMKANFNMGKKVGFEGYWVDAFYPTEDPACYVVGDTYFTKEALKQIVETETNDILFFGTAKPFAPGYTKPGEEPLAFKVVNQKRFRECIDKVKYAQDHNLTKRVPISGELYRVIDGIDINTHRLGKRFVGVHYFAEDIDHKDEVPRLEATIKKYKY